MIKKNRAKDRMKDRSFGPMKKRLVFETETELDRTDPTLVMNANTNKYIQIFYIYYDDLILLK